MNNKLDKRTKWTYCVGATGRDMAYALVSLYLITYVQYTMGLTVAQYAAITACVVVCLIWDAINDPMMGVIIENTHLKGGKFRPWILLGVLTNAVIIVLLFTLRPTGWLFVAFFGISYCLWGMTFTMNDISYWGMLPSLSSDAGERNSLLSLMSIFCCIGQFAVAGLVPIFLAGNAIFVYRLVALITALCFLGFQLLTFFGVKERPRTDNPEKLTLKKMFKTIARNDQLVHIGIATLLFNICNGLLIIFGTNFFYMEFGYEEGGNLIFLFTVMYGLGTFLSQGLFSTISAKFKRASLLKFFMICILIGYALFFMTGLFLIPMNIIIINAIGFFIFFCQGFYNMLVVLMLNNTIEYDEYKNNERHDSVVASVRSFAVKLSSAINQGISSLVLIISGIYGVCQKIANLEIEKGQGLIKEDSEVLSRANAYISEVTAGQRLGLRIGIVSIPAIMIILSYIIIRKKYIIDEEMYDKMVKEIADRKKEA